jgi:hypothetical protein
MTRKFDIEKDYIAACRLLAELQQDLDRALRYSLYKEDFNRFGLWTKAFALLQLLQTHDSPENSQAFDAKAEDREDEMPK